MSGLILRPTKLAHPFNWLSPIMIKPANIGPLIAFFFGRFLELISFSYNLNTLTYLVQKFDRYRQMRRPQPAADFM